MADQIRIEEFKARCKAIKQLASQKEHYIQRPEWGTITFEDIESDIDKISWLVEQIDSLPIDIVDDNVINQMMSHLSQIKQCFGQIGDFSLTQGDPNSRRKSIASSMKQQIQNAISTMGPWIPLLAFRAGKIQNWNAQMKGDRDSMAKLLRETTAYVEERRNEIDAATREAAGKVGAAEFTHEFRRQAEEAEKRGKRWLWPTVISAAAALGLAGALMFGLLGETPSKPWEAIYRLGGRVIAISVLFYAAVWSGRIVLANLHLASVNSHRAVSLQTLQAFHRAAADGAAKDAVVLEAARAVYENVPSGYIARQGGGPGGSARTLEVIKGAARPARSDGDG